MVSNEFDVEAFERRLQTLKDSQESIQSLSAWCLERRQHHKKIVATWLQVLKKVKVEHRLTLFYLANDVIQYSKRKNFEFVESWGTTLQRATTMVRDEKVKHRILRIFKIWDQRGVYDEEFLTDLSGLISAVPKKKIESQPIQQPEEFQAALLISTMRSCATLEQATDARLKDLRETNVDFDNAEELCSSLKDRRRVEDAEKEVDLAAKNIENYVKALEAEIRERKQVLDLLEQADQFYETQRGEVKIVVNAYRNFGSRVKNLKKKLDELLPMLTSPLPSPDVNAPSPSPDSEIELPEDSSLNQSSLINVAPPTMYGTYGPDYNPGTITISNTSADFSNNFSSFIGGNVDFDTRNIFNDNSAVSESSQQFDSIENKTAEIVDMRSSETQNINDETVSTFLKSVVPSSNIASNSCSIPGLGLDAGDILPEPNNDFRPSIIGIQTTPLINRIITIPTTQVGSLGHIQPDHSTPLLNKSHNGESNATPPYSNENSQNNSLSVNTYENSGMNPLQPPPMPPIQFLDENTCYNKLPTKFPTWTFANEVAKEPSKSWKEKVVFPVHNDTNPIWPVQDGKIKTSWNESSNDQWSINNSESGWNENPTGKCDILSETPESPPTYEKVGFNIPLEYNDSQSQEPILSSIGDVDHRILPLPISVEKQLSQRLIKSADVDHRNLISLTGSPANNSNDATSCTPSNTWPTSDQDYRRTINPAAGDNIESVDMEMSDEENEIKKNNRVLVDVKSQDRDMRISSITQQFSQSGSLQHDALDMDMRILHLTTNSTKIHRVASIVSELQNVNTRPPPPPPIPTYQQNQANFAQEKSNFRGNTADFRSNQSFVANLQEFSSKQNFPSNTPTSDFRPVAQDFFHTSLSRSIPVQQNSSNQGIGNKGKGYIYRRGIGPRVPWMERGCLSQRTLSVSNFPSPSHPPQGLGGRGIKLHRGTLFRSIHRGRGRGNSW